MSPDAPNKPGSEETFKALRIKEAGVIAGKPRFLIQSKSVINTKSEFKKKLLCDGLTFTAGHACVFSCQFCYVASMLRKNQRLNVILKEKGLKFEEVVVEIADAPKTAKKSLLSRGKPKYNDPKDHRIIYASPLVDVAATVDQVRATVEICQAILKLTHWHIRLLSKSPLLLEIAKQVPEEFKDRMIYGLSTGTLDSSLSEIYEVGTPLVSKRLEALHWLQDNGYRTFGMICPILPQKDYDRLAREVAEKVRVERCEHIWAEVLNQRGGSLKATGLALKNAGRTEEADLVGGVTGDKSAWEDYARNTFSALRKSIPPEKFHFLQYVTQATRGWWERHTRDGAVLLGTAATAEKEAVREIDGSLNVG